MSKRFSAIIIMSLTLIFFLTSCLTTNIPDKLSINHSSETIKTYQILRDHITRLEHLIIPGQAMKIDFWYNSYGYYYNTNYLDIVARLYIQKQYEKLYIKEISYIFNDETHNLIENEYFVIPNITENDILFDENDEPILVNGENYYWTSIDLNKRIRHHFINGSLGQEKEIEVIQIYSFDDEPFREEICKYKVICGGIEFDPQRLISWMFPP